MLLFFKETDNGIEDVKLDNEVKQSIMEELSHYQLVYTRTITWERLDDDREGEDVDEKFYALGEEDCPIDYHIIIKDNQFVGVGIFYTETTSWNAGLNKQQFIGGCTLYKDGSVKGSATSSSSYDSPNNHDDVRITYSLRKIK